MNDAEFNKLHDEVIQKTLEYSNHLIEDGIKKVSWTLTNSFVVTFRDLKRKPRSHTDKMLEHAKQASKLAKQL